MVLAEKIELTRRGLLVKAGAGAAGAAALTALGSAPASVALAAPAQQTPVASTLRLRFAGEPDSIDPQKASFIDEIEVIMRCFRNLMQFDPQQNIVPDTAEAPPAITDNGTTLTFTVKQNAMFSDGTPVRAQDFVYAWQRHMDPRTEGQYAFLGYIIAGGEALNQADPKTTSADQFNQLRSALGVTAPDDRTVQFKLTAAAPWFMSVLTTWCGVPVRQQVIAQANGGDEFSSKWVEPATYVGNGPYKLTAHEPDVRFHFTANDKYAGGAPPIKEVEFTVIKEQAVAFAAYLNGELDMVSLTSEDKPRVDADASLSKEFVQFPDALTTWLAMSAVKPPFDNQKVRLAFAYALDRVSFVRNIEGGQGIPARQLIPPGFPGNFEFELEEQVFNPEVAKRLLAEAGYPGGKGLPEVKFQYASTAVTKRRAEGYAALFKDVLGVDMLLDPVESRTLVQYRKKVETYPQITRAGWHQDYADPQNWYSTVFNSKQPVDKTGWKNPEFDRLTDAADVELDNAKRMDLYRQAAQLFINDAPVIFSHYNVIWRMVKPRVQGYKPNPLEFFIGEQSLYNLSLAG